MLEIVLIYLIVGLIMWSPFISKKKVEELSPKHQGMLAHQMALWNAKPKNTANQRTMEQQLVAMKKTWKIMLISTIIGLLIYIPVVIFLYSMMF